MAVLLGEIGKVELRRTQLDESLSGTVKSSDVNPTKDRFSFDFPLGLLITGDQIEMKTTDGSLLSFIAASGWPTNQVTAMAFSTFMWMRSALSACIKHLTKQFPVKLQAAST